MEKGKKNYSWLFGELQRNGIDTEDMTVREAFERLEQLRKKRPTTMRKDKDLYTAGSSEAEEEVTVETTRDVRKPKKPPDTNAKFDKQVDAILIGADTTSTHLRVTDTPQILQDVGLPNLPILMTAKHLRSVTLDSGSDKMNYHGLGAETVKKLPKMLAEPVMVMDSLTRDDSVVVLTDTVDKENRPIIAAIKLDGKGYINDLEINANILASTYGRNNFNSFIQRNADNRTILYYNKEKSQELSKIPGIQFPDNLESLDSNTIIRQTRAFVKTKIQKSKEDNKKL